MSNIKLYALPYLLAPLLLIESAHAVPTLIGERAGQLTSTFFAGSLITFDARDGGCQNPIGLPGGFITRDNTPNVHLNPTGSCYLALPRRGEATLTLNGAFRAFGFFWGSIDTFNTVTFRRGGRFIFEINGTEAVRALRLTEGFLNFIFTEEEAFDEVIFFSSAPAFEIDNITSGLRAVSPPVAEEDPIYIPYPPRIPPRDPGFTGLGASFNIEPVSFDLDAQATSVSEPASLALFGAGLAGVGLMAGRRRHTKTA